MYNEHDSFHYQVCLFFVIFNFGYAKLYFEPDILRVKIWLGQLCPNWS